MIVNIFIETYRYGKYYKAYNKYYYRLSTELFSNKKNKIKLKANIISEILFPASNIPIENRPIKTKIKFLNIYIFKLMKNKNSV